MSRAPKPPFRARWHWAHEAEPASLTYNSPDSAIKGIEALRRGIADGRVTRGRVTEIVYDSESGTDTLTGRGGGIPPEIRTAIADVINYNWADEERDFTEHGGEALQPRHVYLKLRRLQRYLETGQ